jgi:hypothetical protein
VVGHQDHNQRRKDDPDAGNLEPKINEAMHPNAQEAGRGAEARRTSISVTRPQRISGSPDYHRDKPGSQANCNETSVGSKVKIIVMCLLQLQSPGTYLVFGNRQKVSAKTNAA